MKMQLEMSNLIVSGQMKETNIGIGDPRIIIHHLVKSAYQRPEVTMVQEIASNAKDANAEAGNAHIPVRIQVPSMLSPELVISDNGFGITPDRIENVYCLIGNSTKRDENISDGGFGIGSKIPLAYTDQFMVKTVCKEGEHLIRRMYAIVKRDDYTIKFMELGEPHIINALDDAEEQHTGTTITIPIKNDDIAKIRKACIYKTEFWTVQPTLTGATAEELAYPKHNWFYTCDDFRFTMDRGENYYRRVVEVIINGVRYPIDENIIHSGDNDGSKKSLNFPRFTGTLILNFGVGELTPALNRESLQFDERTCEILNKRVNAAVETIRSKIASIIDTQPTFLQAWKKMNDFYNGGWINHHGDSMTWNGKKISQQIAIPHTIIKNEYGHETPDYSAYPCHFVTYNVNHAGRMRERQENHASVAVFVQLINEKRPIVYTEKPKVNASALRWFNDNNGGKRGYNIIFTGKRTDIVKFLTDSHIATEVEPLLVCLDTCGYVPAKRTPGGTKVIHKWRSTGRWRNKMETCGYFNKDANESGWYYTYERGNDESLDVGNGKTLNYRIMSDVCSILGLSDRIYGVAPGNVKFLDKTKWKPLCDLFKNGDNKDLHDEIVTVHEYLVRKQTINNSSYNPGIFGKLDLTQLAAESPMRKWLEYVAAMPKLTKPNCKQFHINDCNHDSVITNLIDAKIIKNTVADAKKHDVVQLHHNVQDAYKLLTLGSFTDGDTVKAAMISYINMMDAAAGIKP